MSHTYVELEIEKLKPARFQPSRRTLPVHLAKLMASIAKYGMPTPVVVTDAGNDGLHEIGDGHRRVACAKALGLTVVPATIWHGMEAREIFSILNATQMSMSPAQWLEAVVCGLPIEQPEIPRDMANRIRELIDTVSEEVIWRIVENGGSPEIIATAKFVNGKIGWSDKEHLVKTIEWFLEFKSQSRARAAVASGYTDLMIEAIEGMRNFDFEPVLR